MSSDDRLPAHVGVLGGGRMGSGIAHAFCVSGVAVTIVERDEPSAAAAREHVRSALQASIDRGTTSESLDALSARVAVVTDYAAFADAGLVVEAVPEDFSMKAEALRRVEDLLGPQAWLATNTSSLSVTSLAEQLTRPARLCGLHFFNPVPASGLVEIIVGERSDPELVDLASGWVNALGKTPIVVADAPGFASSRLGVALGLEAIRMVEEGVASPQDIDAAMVLGYKHPVGPLRLTDIVGLDVRLGIAEYLHEKLGERFRPPTLLRSMVERGQLGRKSGQGFYEWTATEAGKQ
ncbi:3-hydroxyacyl-CoA dehydrogenase family protein [Parafrigoribacterium mesophilum]|uniref:3-hydroxyacyl-CoA dehydrogenase family protein n=1 Tax=Parafrigoribacterium mesophilum TaxID=433646 RepID=UPI0031FC1292